MKRYPIDRPFTLDEIDRIINGRTIWIVEFCGVRQLSRVGGYVFRRELRELRSGFYNQAWRAWPYRPSEELRAQAPWGEPMQIWGKVLYSLVREAMKPYRELTNYRRKTDENQTS